MHAKIRGLPGILLWGVIFANHALAITSGTQRQAVGVDTTPTDVGTPGDWQPNTGLPPINGSQPNTNAVNQFRGEYIP